VNTPLTAATTPGLAKDALIVIGGAGGFIGGSLARYFHDQGFTRIRAIDKKPLPDWYQRVPGVESLCMDCVRACEGATEVYNLAADMGGMGFIERYFYSSSVCGYNTTLQQDPTQDRHRRFQRWFNEAHPRPAGQRGRGNAGEGRVT